MEVLIWFSAVSGFLALCKVFRVYFDRKLKDKVFEILGQNRSNGQHHGKEKGKRKGKA